MAILIPDSRRATAPRPNHLSASLHLSTSLVAFAVWCWTGFCFGPAPVLADDPPDTAAPPLLNELFADRIAPLLQDRCLGCHNARDEQGGVSLETLQQAIACGAIDPDMPRNSLILDVIHSQAGQPPSMPKQGPPLDPQEVQWLRAWIAGGAPWPDSVRLQRPAMADRSWWSLQPLQPSTRIEFSSQELQRLKENDRQAWLRDPLDRHILRQLLDHDLWPNPPADRRTWLRRVYYDLIGLPPAPAEVQHFVNDQRPDAYERVVDRLLGSPRYGEKWGRHWMDVIRFGESTGYERNVIIDDLWPLRDYIIAAFNDDKPYATMVREHLAGDVLAPEDPQSVIATALLVCGPYDNVGNQDAVQAAQIRANTIDEMLRTVADAFLGMTIGCARCHDHKFDPISQEDYYGLAAVLAGVQHGRRTVATPQQKAARDARLKPLLAEKRTLEAEVAAVRARVEGRIAERADALAADWQRPAVSRAGTEERFAPTLCRWVRFTCLRRDDSPARAGFQIDEFEVWSAGTNSRNVALASAGAKASGASRSIEDFPGAYGPQLAIDGRFGERFIAAGDDLTIELPAALTIDRVVFSSARDEPPEIQARFPIPAEYRIEVSLDGETWSLVASGHDRLPANDAHRHDRLFGLAITPDETGRLEELNQQIRRLERQIAQIPPLPTVWVGTRDATAARGPFHVFVGGSPQRLGRTVVPRSPAFLEGTTPGFTIDDLEGTEGKRRLALANWIVDRHNPLTPRVWANRLWHYHFGVGLVPTTSDFGRLGQPPSHPALLDWLALELLNHGWRIKPLHRRIVLSQTYRQSSRYRPEAAQVDADAKWMWRWRPRRLSAEEYRDTILQVAGALRLEMGGPGYRLYRYLQDNVATYIPLDEHPPTTFRRAVYHQNARAARVDLLTEFDQPDCAFSAPRRTATTSPLQALTSLNHPFMVDMAQRLAARVALEAGEDQPEQIRLAFAYCFGRAPSAEEAAECLDLLDSYSLPSLCRVLLNSSELLFVF
ncbi:MAG: DUF1553 domain-containing protein [Planctomycetota bacterium]|nr:MAG: DUF1553 domain-containing protein [Planctomycetota bacterium]